MDILIRLFDMSNISTLCRALGTSAIMTLAIVFTACNNGSQKEQSSEAESDSVAVTATEAEPVVVNDTIRGRITDAASRAIELSVLMDLDLPDNVDRQTSIEVGKDVEVVIRHEPDGTQSVIAIRAAETSDE